MGDQDVLDTNCGSYGFKDFCRHFKPGTYGKSTWLTAIAHQVCLRIHDEQSPVGRNMLGCGPLPITVHIRKLKWNPKIGGLPMFLLFLGGIFR